MKRISILSLALLLICNCFSNDKIEISKARKLQRSAWEVKERNVDSTMILAKKAKSLAKIDKDTTLLIRLYKDLSYYYYWGYSDYYKTKLELDTLIKNFGHVMNPTDFANYYSRLGDVLYYDNQKVRSIELYHKALDQNTWDSILIARINHNLGWTYADLGFFEKAVKYAETGIAILKAKNVNPSANIQGLVYIYKTAKEYDKAIEKLEEARPYNKEENNESYFYYRKADLLLKKQDYEDAFETSLKGYKDALLNNKQKYALYNIDVAYSALHFLNDYPNALKYFSLLKNKAHELDNNIYLIKAYNKIGSYYSNENLLDSAFHYLLKAEELGLKYDQTELNNTYQLLSSSYQKNDDKNSMIKYLELSNNYTKNQKTKDSLKYNKSIADQLYRFELENVVTNKNIEIEEKQNQLLLEKEKEKIQKYIIFFIALIAIIIAIFLYIIYKKLTETRLQKETIEEQKEELNQTNEELAAQRDEIEFQKNHLELKNKEIDESIRAAQRIQNAFFTYEEKEAKNLPEHFILFRPLDIVSGDFYWMHHENDLVYLAVVDCTGHGIPGAFLSLLGASLLNEIVTYKENSTPSEILDLLRSKIIKELNQNELRDSSKEGMDISLICINKSTNSVLYSGANNPLYIKRKLSNEIEIIKAHREPIGYIKSPTPFQLHEIQLSKGDLIYLFTDGFADQFGGKKNKKFGYKRLREHLIKNSHLDMTTQLNNLNFTLSDWINEGNEEQIDDICLIGLKL